MPPTATPTIDDSISGADVEPPTLPAAPGLPARLAAGVASGERRVGATVGALALVVAVALGVGSAAGCDFAGVAGATGLGGAVTTGVGRGSGFGVGWAVESGLLNGATVGGATVAPGPPLLKRQS